jgi:hypothetical protein
MTITVTQEDIDNGERWDCALCPVALALKRAIGKPVSVNADGGLTVVDYDLASDLASFTSYSPVIASHQDSVTEFIRKFDEGDDVEPFTFEVLV